MKYQTIIDVRTREEFALGSVESSINIPLQEIIDREKEVIALAEPVLFCCEAGGRAGQASDYFSKKGLNCENGGGWKDVKRLLEK